MKERIIPLKLGFVSVFAIRGKQTVLVDTGIPGKDVEILELLRKEGIEPHEIKLIILTHFHQDHSGSAEYLKEKTKAKILVHRLDAHYLRDGTGKFPKPLSILGSVTYVLFMLRKSFQMFSKKKHKPQGVEPDIVIDDDFDLEKFGIAGRIIHTPGHTSGSLSVILDSGDAIVGDLIGSLFKKKRPSYPLWGVSLKQIKESIRKVMSYHPKKVYASHAGPFSGEEIRKTLL
jgi:hydroxyacylglutathione hydrolase